MAKNIHANYHTHITAEHRWFDLNLKEVWRYRDLIGLFVRRNFTVSYKQTVLGPAWIVLTPLFSSIIQAFVFGGIAGIETDGVPMLLFYLCSNAVWGYFANCLVQNANTFTANAHVFGKVYFPRLTTPISNMISAGIRFFVQMILVVLFMVWFLFQGAVHPNWAAWLVIPLELLHLGILGMGFGIVISSLTTKYRDLTILVEFGITLWMYITPVVYPLSTPQADWMRTLLQLNPVTPSMELIRYAVLGKGTLDLGYYGLSWTVTLVLAVLGIMVFNKVERTFMDTV